MKYIFKIFKIKQLITKMKMEASIFYKIKKVYFEEKRKRKFQINTSFNNF